MCYGKEDGRTLAALDEGRISILANGLGGVRVDVLEEDGAEDGQPWLLYVEQSAGTVDEELKINIKRIFIQKDYRLSLAVSKAGLAYAIGFKLVLLESTRSLEYKVIGSVMPISEDVSKF